MLRIYYLVVLGVSNSFAKSPAVREDESISLPTWTRLQTDEHISVQKWNSPQGGQVHYTSYDRGQSSAL